VLPDEMGNHDARRKLRALLHDVLPLRAVSAGGRDRGSQRRLAASESASDGGRRVMGLMTPALPPGELFGVLGEFASPKDLYHACEKVRDAGYTRWDAHTPFPVHGLDHAMGLKRSRL